MFVRLLKTTLTLNKRRWLGSLQVFSLCTDSLFTPFGPVNREEPLCSLMATPVPHYWDCDSTSLSQETRDLRKYREHILRG